ncbi:hypothetical protein BBJ28_00002662 [Nothophytophthora sp. Chile5]|nr:hypothetical protein BBJ28_00002662 [Nothophytophthora sp. Chile5]
MTPYLTCQRCNSVAFIDLRRVRRKADQQAALAQQPNAPDEEGHDLYEQVPKCPGCGSTRYLRAGVVSFQEQIEEEKNVIKEFERRRGPATALLQRIARGFLGRILFRRRLLERERYLRKINRAATKLQTRVRGMQARKRTIIERCLRLIRTMASSILSYALAARPNEPPVFWYANAAELNIFYWNYREYVRRSGGKPTLIKVESNVLEITRRMLRREHALVSRIQSRWRGLTTRLVFREFKRQKGWWKGIRQSPAIKIQRLVRGHASRRRVGALQVTTKYPTQLEDYRQEMATREQKSTALAFRQRLLAKYRLARQVDRTKRMIVQQGKLPARKSSKAGGGDDGDELGPESNAHVLHSLRTTSSSSGSNPNTVKTEMKAESENRRTHMRNPNASRFAEVKRQLEGQGARLRGPRLHILKAQLYAPSDGIRPPSILEDERT